MKNNSVLIRNMEYVGKQMNGRKYNVVRNVNIFHRDFLFKLSPLPYWVFIPFVGSLCPITSSNSTTLASFCTIMENTTVRTRG